MHQIIPTESEIARAVTAGHYRLIRDGGRVHIFTASNSIRGPQVPVHRGQVWLGPTGEWNVHYTTHADWLPINDCLDLLGYKYRKG